MKSERKGYMLPRDEAEEAEDREGLRVFLLVEISATPKISWSELRVYIKKAIDLTPGALFEDLMIPGSPDPYDLDDPDDPPEDFR